MNEVLIISGLVLAGFALRTFASVWLRRLGGIVMLYASYRCGVGLFGRVWVGCVFVSLWFLIPVVQVIFVARRLNLPLEKKLRQRVAPSSDEFPDLRDISREFEEAGFEHCEDVGWEAEDNGLAQFSRLMVHPSLHLQGSIHLHSHYGASISYVMLTTRTKNGDQWISWNYPLSSNMKMPPNVTIQRVADVTSLAEMLELHEIFILSKVAKDQILTPEPERLVEYAQEEMRDQIDHNLDAGLLRLSGEGRFAYSWRGCLYIVRQLMIDLVRQS